VLPLLAGAAVLFRGRRARTPLAKPSDLARSFEREQAARASALAEERAEASRVADAQVAAIEARAEAQAAAVEADPLAFARERLRGRE
jgi:hypothetical protein